MATFGQGPTPWSPSARAREWERGATFSRGDARPPARHNATGTDGDRGRHRPSRAEPEDEFVRKALHRRYE